MVDETLQKDTFDEVMTTSDVIKYLKVSRKTVLKLVHEGKIPAQKVGKDFRYLRSEIDAYLRGKDPHATASKSYFSA
jgi:excisionase family DNA binding protein